MYPTLAVIGRPNVGKSSLFNRLVGKRYAIVSEIAGTTRDRICDVVREKDFAYYLVDTGGIMDSEGEIEENVQMQAKIAMHEADVILFLMDGRDEITSTDREIAETLKRGDKPFLVAVNKIDNPEQESNAAAYYELGFPDLLFLSAAHGRGTDALEKAIRKIFRNHNLLTPYVEEVVREGEKDVTKVTLVGAPNVGKSSLLNAILGKNRAIVSDVAGTTRDTVDTPFEMDGQPYLLIDTAGLRRRGRIERGIEKFSVLRTMRAITRADVALLVIDAKRGVTHQEKAIVSYILAEKKGVILVVNKWDIVEKDNYTMEKYVEYLRHNFEFLPYAPVVFVSAKTSQRVQQIFPLVNTIVEERNKRIDTGELNAYIEYLVLRNTPRGTKTIKPKLKYVTQVGVNPPHFLLFVNKAEAFHFSYIRYIENKLREKYGFSGSPIVLEFREGKDSRRMPKEKKTYKRTEVFSSQERGLKKLRKQVKRSEHITPKDQAVRSKKKTAKKNMD